MTMPNLPNFDGYKLASPYDDERDPDPCDYCGADMEEEFEGETMCQSCFDEKTTICSQCKERVFVDNAENGICDDCYIKNKREEVRG